MLFRFLVIGVLAATATELAEFKPVGRGLLILGRYVVSTLAVVTLKHNIIAWHNLNPDFVLCTLYFALPLSAETNFDQAPSSKYKARFFLLDYFRDSAGAHRAAPFANCEAQSFFHRDRRD